MIITAGYVDRSIGTATRLALAPSTAAFNQYEEQARVTVQSRAAVAGYTIADDSTNAMVKLLVLGQFYVHALGFRKGLELPPMVAQQVTDLDRVESGKLPITGMTPSVGNAVGGVTLSSTTDRPQAFSSDALKNW